MASRPKQPGVHDLRLVAGLAKYLVGVLVVAVLVVLLQVREDQARQDVTDYFECVSVAADPASEC